MSTSSGAPFSFTLPEDSDLADLVGVFLKPALQTINTYGVHTTATQTLTNKTLTSPTLTTPSLSNPTVGTGVLTLQAGTAGAPALTTSGDTNTGTFYPAADTIAWATGGSERVRINSSGNVGIGTSSPSEKLHISNGNFAIDKSAYGGYLKWTQGTTSPRAGYWEWGDGTGWRMDFGPPATPRLSIYDSGNVGIGTSSPAYTLDVNGHARFPSNYAIFFNDPSGTARRTVHLASTGYFYLGDVDNFTGSRLFLRGKDYVHIDVDTVTRMTVNYDGNVGIGTSSPSAGLHVVSSASLDARIEGGYPQGVSIQNGAFWEHKNASDTGDLSFNYAGYQNGTTYYRDINIYNGKYGLIARFQGSTGRLGIGTSSPSATLHVVGDVNIAPTTGGAYHTIRGIQAGQNAHQYFYTSNALKWVQYANDSNSRLYFLDADSNDGVYIAQNTTSWTANSDSRLKDVQGTITDALAKVGQLTGVKFTWKRDADNPDAKVRVGLIAQDVQAVLPEAVDDESPDLITDEETGKISGGLGVRYTEVVPLLVNAIKELTARVVTLEQAAA